MKESDEQIMLIQWLQLKKLFFFAPMTENQQSSTNKMMAIRIAQKAKKMGKVKGTSDVFVMLPNKLLVIELKSAPKKLKSGKLSVSHTKVLDEQKKFLESVNEFSYIEGVVAYGFDEAKEFIERNML